MKKIFPVSKFARLPSYGTQKSACFDIRCCLRGLESINAIDRENKKVKLPVVLGQNFAGENNTVVRSWSVVIPAGYNVLVPTGMIFHIPEDKQLKLHPRSGLAYKKHLTLANCEGVIDCDYPDQTYVALANTSDVSVIITHDDEYLDEDGNKVEQGGERVCQGEFVDYVQETFDWTDESDIENSTDRAGGLGHTGTK